MIYLDTSAMVKLLLEEAESGPLVDWLNQQRADFVASVLVEVELPRALLRRNAPQALPKMAALLMAVSRLDFDAPVRATAAAYTDPYLRALDAIHLATADQLAASGEAITAFVSYDKRLLAAAAAAGLPAASPGA